jgi:hypothetical protein
MLLSTRRRIISGVLVSGEPVLPRGWTVEIATATSHVRDRQLSQPLALNTHCSTNFGGVPSLRCAVRILGTFVSNSRLSQIGAVAPDSIPVFRTDGHCQMTPRS